MKHPKTTLRGILSMIAALSLLAACGPGEPAATAPVDRVEITGNDRMQFSLTEFTVAAGTEITIEFRNVGRMPKEAMGHNLAVLEAGTDTIAFANAATRHADNEFIPVDMEDQVIASTKVLGPGEEETLTFTAPSTPGDYPFVCSFPAHTQAGMVGTMRVVE